jgi:uncharacterized protein
MSVFFIVFFTVYSAVNYYMFIRGWQALQGVPSLRIPYLILFLIAALSYLTARIFSRNLPVPVHDILTWIGSFWFAYILYVLLFILLLDLVRLGNYFFNFYPSGIKSNYLLVKQIVFASVFIISSIIIAAGYFNTRTFTVTTINIEMPRKSSSLTELKAVILSDLHLSTINDKYFLDDIIAEVNALEPDIILIPGDIVDDRADYLTGKGIGPGLRNLNSKYGVYASTGNHEFINGADSSASYLRRNGINLLRDETNLLDGMFYIVGREDTSKINFTGKKRKTLTEIMHNINPDYPVFLMDHTPFNLEEAAYHKVDLQVSGHTHHGQLYPLNYITSRIYEVSWGYKKKSSTHYYVSSGVGTWGPPVRTGSSSEIVLVNIKLK